VACANGLLGSAAGAAFRADGAGEHHDGRAGRGNGGAAWRADRSGLRLPSQLLPRTRRLRPIGL
jgi:hypothetical protein